MMKIILIILLMIFSGFINEFLTDIGYDYSLSIGFMEGMLTCFILYY